MRLDLRYAVRTKARNPGYALTARRRRGVLFRRPPPDRHEYAIMQDIASRTGGQIKLRPSSVYSAIHRVLEEGLIEVLDERPGDERQLPL